MVTLYTTPGCLDCKTLRDKLVEIGIDFKEETNANVMKVKGIAAFPILEADGSLMTASAAYEWIDKYQRR